MNTGIQASMLRHFFVDQYVFWLGFKQSRHFFCISSREKKTQAQVDFRRRVVSS